MKTKQQKESELKAILEMIVNKRLQHSVMLCDIFALAPSGGRKHFTFMIGRNIIATYSNRKFSIKRYSKAIWGNDRTVFEMFSDVAESTGVEVKYSGGRITTEKKKNNTTKTKKQ
jgi:hypothetical protein